jgi:hypothetical protein
LLNGPKDGFFEMTAEVHLRRKGTFQNEETEIFVLALKNH